MKKEIIAFKNFLLDLLFPIECLSCGKDGKWLCPFCVKKIPKIKKESYSVCDSPTENWQFCDGHKKEFILKGIISPFDYDNSLLQTAIKTYKYRFVRDLSAIFGKMLASELKKYDFLLKNSVLVPVPLHRFRQNWRGFNQAELLALQINKELALQISEKLEKINIPVINLLKRTRQTATQVSLKKEDRKENVKNAFALIKNLNFDFKNKTIILIDDVATTCATLEECAKILYSNGAKEIWGLVLAKG